MGLLKIIIIKNILQCIFYSTVAKISGKAFLCLDIHIFYFIYLRYIVIMSYM